jgi:predicted transcriptional regulator
MNEKQVVAIINNLETIKKLMVFQLVEKGFSQSILAQALGVSQPTISRMVPKSANKKRLPADEQSSTHR